MEIARRTRSSSYFASVRFMPSVFWVTTGIMLTWMSGLVFNTASRSEMFATSEYA